MATDETDQPGVLGNLPRSRPGQRSEKRGSGARAAPSTRAKATTRPRPAPKRKPATTRKPAASAPSRERPQAAAAQPVSASPDPLTAAVRAAGKVAEVGLKTAGSILRRLPGR